MSPDTFIDPCLTKADRLVLDALLEDIASHNEEKPSDLKADVSGNVSVSEDGVAKSTTSTEDNQTTIDTLESFNNPSNSNFEPTAFNTWDLQDLKIPSVLDRFFLQPYIRCARSIVRVETDVLVVTHLLLYFFTSVPSAIYLFYHFSWIHGVFHLIMQGYYMGTYTLMMHQHIHMRGVLAKKLAWLDMTFPFLLDPLMGHTWNTYFYHHVKHHHVEGNGPEDLSSTLRYQRDSALDFACYVGRFFFFVWLDLPLYFIKKGKPVMGLKALASEFTNYAMICCMAIFVNWRPALFALMLPLALMRIAMMVGNWGQHALVDEVDPDSDFRSSITLIDVSSNRYCFNDGYHTSHHLNPLRHWREHPVAFMKQKKRYSDEHALVFRNIDYVFMTIKLLQKDYVHLAKCLIPIGDQIGMSLEDIAAMLERKTRRFTEEEIKKKFKK